MSAAVKTRTSPGWAATKGFDIADFECRPVIGRADDPEPQRIWRNAVGAEAVRAVHLFAPVEPCEPRSNGIASAGGLENRMRAAGGLCHRVEDLAVTGAAAQHAAKRVGNRRIVRCRIDVKERLCRNQHAGRADAALRSTGFQEGILQSPAKCILRQAFDGGDGGALHLAERRQAGAYRLSVQQHGACTAVASVASDLRAGQAQILAEHLAQPPQRVAGDARLLAIDLKFHGGR